MAEKAPEWLVKIDKFADALGEYAIENTNADSIEAIDYMEKAARLLKIMTVAYSNLSNQVNMFYEKEQKLRSEAAEVVELVQNQMKML